MSERIEKYFENPQTRVRRIVLFAIVSVFLSRGIIFLMYEIYASVYSESAGTWLQELNTWDTGWYRTIINKGYDEAAEAGKSQANWAFFPLLPLIVRGIHQLTGLEATLIATIMNTILLIGIVMIAFAYMYETRKSAVQAFCVGLIFTFGAYSFYFSFVNYSFRSGEKGISVHGACRCFFKCNAKYRNYGSVCRWCESNHELY